MLMFGQVTRVRPGRAQSKNQAFGCLDVVLLDQNGQLLEDAPEVT